MKSLKSHINENFTDESRVDEARSNFRKDQPIVFGKLVSTLANEIVDMFNKNAYKDSDDLSPEMYKIINDLKPVIDEGMSVEDSVNTYLQNQFDPIVKELDRVHKLLKKLK
jgi:succinylarginine dihydrolase